VGQALTDVAASVRNGGVDPVDGDRRRDGVPVRVGLDRPTGLLRRLVANSARSTEVLAPSDLAIASSSTLVAAA
jgi:hypothetical protein